jgi:hypothetical protein
MDKCRVAQDVRERPRTANRVVNSHRRELVYLTKSVTCNVCRQSNSISIAAFLSVSCFGLVQIWYTLVDGLT